MKDGVLEKVNLSLCSYLAWIAREACKEKPIITPTDGRDVCTSLLPLKCCPFPGYGYATHYLPSHLAYKHRLKDGVEMEKHLA